MRRGTTAGVVNIDGYGPGRDVGMPAGVVLRYQHDVMASWLASRPDASGSPAVADLPEHRAASVAAMSAFGIAPELEVRAFDRSTRRQPDGSYAINP